MDFYTNVSRRGNNILYRGYSNGQRVQEKFKYQPTLYSAVPQSKSNGFTALDGTPVKSITFPDMKAAKEYVETYKEVKNHKIYGHLNYIMQFITEVYPNNIEYNTKTVRIHNIDIEVHSGGGSNLTGRNDDNDTTDEGGFPEPAEAKYPVTCICLYDSIEDTYFVWSTCIFNKLLTENTDVNIEYTFCEDEYTLLKHFIAYFSGEFTAPDIITGWNTRTFDIPYLVNRINRLMGMTAVNSLSPWNSVQERMITIRKKLVQTYDISGISHLDLMDLFMKFGYSYGPQESYRLDHIGYVVLDERKMDYSEYDSLGELFNENPQKYVDYCIKDVKLVNGINDKIGLINIVLTLAYKAGVNYDDTLGTTAIWDQIIHRYLMNKNIVVPPNETKFKEDYEGGYVKEPFCGVHDNLASIDAKSLYPNIMVQWNMSPETILKNDVIPNMTVERMLKENPKSESSDKTLAASGQYFSIKKQGCIPHIIESLYSERVQAKDIQLEYENLMQRIKLTLENPSNKIEYTANGKLYKLHELNTDGLHKLDAFADSEIAKYENLQMSIKILLNSLYGACGSKYFRYFEMAMAEAITLTGQYVIKSSEKGLNDYLNKVLGTNKDFVVAIDTDSCYFSLDDLVKKVLPSDATITQRIDFMDKVCQTIDNKVLTPLFKNIFENTNGFKQRISMKRECLVERGIWCMHPETVLTINNGQTITVEALYNKASIEQEPNVLVDGVNTVMNFSTDLQLIKQDTIELVMRKWYSGDMYTLNTNNKSIKVTADHLVLVKSKNGFTNWVKAKDLVTNDIVLEDDLIESTLSITKEHYEGWVYDVSMKDDENFFANGICIHNCAKKRYILNVWDKEGVRYSEPKLKIMGIEAIKSSTPEPCRKAFKKMFKLLMVANEQDIQKFIADFREEFNNLSPEEKAFPRSVSGISKYEDSVTKYKSRTPINSRAAIMYNYYLDKLKLANKYEKIKAGEKIKYIYLNPKNPTREDVIAFPVRFPPEFNLEKYIDNHLQFEKAFLKPAKLILDAINWTATKKSSLKGFIKRK